MKNIFFLLILFSSSVFSQTQMAIFVKGQGYVYKTFVDSTLCQQWVNAIIAGGVTDNSITNAKLAGSITAAKLVGSDITLAQSQVTNLVTNLAAKQGVSAAATTATTGTMTVTMTSATQSAFTITPTGACTFNASGGTAGAEMKFIITTSGSSSFVMTWGTNFKTVGTLATGVTTAKVFVVSFICKDGTNWYETARTTAM